MKHCTFNLQSWPSQRLPIEQQFEQGKPTSESAPPPYASLDINTIMKKDPRTYTMDDRMALSRHSKRKMELKE